MSKIYALYFDEKKHEMKISCEKHWEEQRELLQDNHNIVVKYNCCIYLSFNRTTLVDISKSIKEEWLRNQYDVITKIANINLK